MRLPVPLIVLLLVGGAGLMAAIYGGGESEWGAIGVCLISIAFAAAIVVPRLKRIYRKVMPDFLDVFLLFQILNKSLTIVSLMAGDMYRESFSGVDLVSPVYLLRAEVVHLVTMMLFVAGWRFYERVWEHRTNKTVTPYGVPSLMVVYAVSTFMALGLAVLGPRLGFGMLANFSFYIAVASIGLILISPSQWGFSGRWRWFTLALLAPHAYFAAASGTKGQILMVALPVLIAGIYLGFRKLIPLAALVGVLLFAIGIPLSKVMRAANWESWGSNENIGLVEGLSRVADGYQATGFSSQVTESFVTFCHRANSAQIGGLVMYIAERDGHLGAEPLRLLPAMFIPRVLWPGKPVFAPGAWVTWYLGKASSPETASSATATMLGTEMYWMFGGPGLSLILLLGALYRFVWGRMQTMAGRGVVGVAAMYSLFGEAIRFEETHVIYAIGTPIVFLFYAFALLWVERAVRAMVKGVGRRR